MEHSEGSVFVPTKSPSDDREYRYVILKNGLHALLVSDPETDKAAAACDVNVGSMCDPPNLLGLAHFLEHMLFMGSKKYPDENAYGSFLSEKGGSSNAYTSAENTNYYFDVTKEHLRAALDIFAQFFICPLMSESATEREMKAVHSENKKNLQADAWRMQQLIRSSANPEHPFHQFSTGNLDTLDVIPKSKNINTRDELLRFHEKFYSANLMRVSILGKEDLDTLESWVRECFEPVENKNLKPVSFAPVKVFEKAQLARSMNVVPVKELRRVTLVWPLPPTHEQYDAAPTNYVSHLLGHEGEGSVYAFLKHQGWATALVSGPSNTTKEFDFFKIDIDLTEEGFKQREKVVETVFQYIRMLKEQGPQEWIFNEMKVVGDIEFQNVNKRKPISYVSALATSMQWYKPKDVISAAYLHERYDPALIKSIVDCLTPDNLLLLNISKDFKGKTDLTEQWYGTEYSSAPIDDQSKARLASVSLNSALSLPPRNEFIPDDLSLRPVPEEAKGQKEPKLIRDGPQSKLWFLQDSIYELPKGSVQLQIWSPESYSSPHNSTTTRIMAMLVQDALNEFSYNAQIAGLDYKIEFNVGGVLLVIMGFNQKIPVLLNKIIAKLSRFDILQERFAVIKEKFLRDLVNFAREPPHAHSSYFMMMCSMHPRWGWEEQVNILKELELKHVAAFVPLFIKSSRLEWLIHGNFSQQEALEMVDSVEALLPASKHHSPWPSVQRSIKFHKGTEYIYQRSNINADDHNSAVYSWYQAGSIDDTVLSAQMSLIDEILREPCYDQLRTKEQLGYIVWSTLRTSCGVTGWRVTVQSSEFDAQHVDSRVEAFVESAVSILQEMKEDEFQAFVDAVIAKNLEKPHSIFSMNMQLWEEISVQKYVFDRRERESDILRKTKKEDVIALFKRTVADKATRRKMSVHLYAHGKAVPAPIKDDSKRVYIEDIYAFRERMPLCAPNQ